MKLRLCENWQNASFYGMTAKDIWHTLERHLHQELLGLNPTSQKTDFVLLVSGGADSLAMLLAFASLQKAPSLGVSYSVLHFNHGLKSVSKQVAEFRLKSQDLVGSLCSKLGVRFEVVENLESGDLSEQGAREFRQNQVAARLNLKASQIFVWAHHQDDLLETRFLRLIRGTGVQGLPAMQVYKSPHFRPWLTRSRAQIEEYLKSKNQAWMIDPDQENLRSWLRSECFPMLEKRQPGALVAMARSLDHLAQTTNEDKLGPLLLSEGEAISHPMFLCLSSEQQRQTLAQYLFLLGHRSYTRGQINEILKHLDKIEVIHKFHIAGLEWCVNAEQIRAHSRS